MKKKKRKKTMYWIGGLLILTLVLPNTTNFKERKAFSDRKRLKEAREIYTADQLGDSITLIPGEYYDRSKAFTMLFGKKNREIWNEPVTASVFDYDKTKGGLKPVDVGGSNQTIAVDYEDSEEREWVIRSMNKDQKNVLPAPLRITFLRFMLRDQAAAVNPYGTLVVPVLSKAIGIYHKNPELVFVPYDENYGDYNERMAGRLGYLEEHLNSSWAEAPEFGSPHDIINTEDLYELIEEEIKEGDTIEFDTGLYLKTRLFDMLISDWDRHEGQWEWAVHKSKDYKMFKPIPKDRDIAFYVFDEGILSHIAMLFSPKIQSFRKSYGKVKGLAYQSRELDKMILHGVAKETFVDSAKAIQRQLTDEVITAGFRQYPDEVYQKMGKEHEEILKIRLEKLPGVAEEFYEIIQK